MAKVSVSVSFLTDVVFGADDFLPCLTWVLLRSELVNLQIETDYMMELLDPTQLQGEGPENIVTLTYMQKKNPNTITVLPKHMRHGLYFSAFLVVSDANDAFREFHYCFRYFQCGFLFGSVIPKHSAVAN